MAEINANIIVEPITLAVTQDTTNLGVTVDSTSLNLYTTAALASGGVGELQYNDNGRIAGIPITTFDGNNLTLGDVSNVKLNGGNTAYFLQTDGTGNLTWAQGTANVSGNGTAAGSNTQIQVSDGTGNFVTYAGYTIDGTSLSAANLTVTSTNVHIGNISVATDYSIAIGYNSTSNATTVGHGTAGGVAVGRDTYAATKAVSIGEYAGRFTSNTAANAHFSIAIGQAAGYGNSRGGNSIAIGRTAGVSQAANSIAIGTLAGVSLSVAGERAIAIGANAGINNTHANTIIFNATGANLDSIATDSLYVKPIRQASGERVLTYNVTTGEITQTGSLEFLGQVKANLFAPIANGSANLGLTGSRFANAFINDLNITDSISANITPNVANSTSITHKIPITIDGNVYYICLDSAP